MDKTETMKRYEAETGKRFYHMQKRAVEGDINCTMSTGYVAWLEAKANISDEAIEAFQKIIRNQCDEISALKEKAEAYDRVIEKLSLWGKHLKSASMAQNSLDFVYCAQQVMDEITLTLPDGWEERMNQEETFDYNLEQLGLK